MCVLKQTCFFFPYILIQDSNVIAFAAYKYSGQFFKKDFFFIGGSYSS